MPDRYMGMDYRVSRGDGSGKPQAASGSPGRDMQARPPTPDLQLDA